MLASATCLPARRPAPSHAGFVLPLLQRLSSNRPFSQRARFTHPSGRYPAPTRELAAQVEIGAPLLHASKARVAGDVRRVVFGPQMGLSTRRRVLVATPAPALPSRPRQRRPVARLYSGRDEADSMLEWLLPASALLRASLKRQTAVSARSPRDQDASRHSCSTGRG